MKKKEKKKDGNDGGRTVEAGVVRTLEAKGAIHKHNDVPRFPERRRDRACGVNVYQLKRPLSRLDGKSLFQMRSRCVALASSLKFYLWCHNI